MDFWIPTFSPRTPTQVAGNSNSFLSRLLNRDTITRISYKSKSLVGWWDVCTRVAQERYSSLLWSNMPADDAYFLQDLSLELLFPESFGFITYQGSLSTPPCSETVTWILIDRALNITSLQVTLSLLPTHTLLHHLPSFPTLTRNWRGGEGQVTLGAGVGLNKAPPARS